MIPLPLTNSALIAAINFLNIRGRDGWDEFEFPDYAGIPEEISSKLYSQDVDYIQENWDELS